MKRKMIIVGVVVFLLLAWAAIFVVIFSLISRSRFTTQNNHPERRAEPFKFAHPRPPPVPANTGGKEGLTPPDVTGLADFTSNIPIIVLRSESPGYISHSKSYSPFQMEIYEPSNGAPACMAGPPTVRTRVGLHLRGMLSRTFAKLSYKLKVQDDSGAGESRPLLGMPADADWVLQGPWLDKSLIRNSFSYDLARAMGCAAMRTRPCEVFLSTSGRPVTEANYVGVYDLIEHIDRGKERVNVTKMGPDDNAEPAITGGYILCSDAGEGNYLPSFESYDGLASLQLRYPKQPSPQQMAWIDHWCRQFDQVVRSGNPRDPVRGYAAYIDVDAWVNYILFEELIFNLDGYERSFYLQMDRGAKMQPGPVWDHDLAMGHQLPRGTRFGQWWYENRPRPNPWIVQLAADPDFFRKMAQRWVVLRRGVLSDDQVAARIDTFARPLLSGAADRNFERWPILNMTTPPNKLRNITFATRTYPEQIVTLKKFLHQRAAWMDTNLRQ